MTQPSTCLQNIRVELEQAAKQWLAQHGYNEMYGPDPGAPHPTTIRQPLAEEILLANSKRRMAAVTLEEEKLAVHPK